MRIPIAAFVAVALCSCGQPSPETLVERGRTAFDAGEYTSAYGHLDRALQRMDDRAPDYVSVAIDRLRALSYVDDDGARDEFLALARDREDEVTARDFHLVTTELANAKSFDCAISVLEAGIERHPDDPKLAPLIEEVERARARAAEGRTRHELESIPYVSGD